MKKYRPSNGTEGSCFTSQWCDICARDKFDETTDIDEACTILGDTLIMEVEHPDYPKEWICEDDGGKPQCTAFLHEEHREQLEKGREIKRLDKAEEAWREAVTGA